MEFTLVYDRRFIKDYKIKSQKKNNQFITLRLISIRFQIVLNYRSNKLSRLKKKSSKTTLNRGFPLHHTQTLISQCESAKTSKRSVSAAINLPRFIIQDPYNMGNPIQRPAIPVRLPLRVHNERKIRKQEENEQCIRCE